MPDAPTPRDLDENYARLLAAIRAEAKAGLISPEQAVSTIQAVERDWRTNRWDVVQAGFTRMISDYRATGGPNYAGVIRMLTNFRDDPKTPMLREHCQCGGRLVKRVAVDPPEDDSLQVDWRCVDCSTLYDVTGIARGKDPSRAR